MKKQWSITIDGYGDDKDDGVKQINVNIGDSTLAFKPMGAITNRDPEINLRDNAFKLLQLLTDFNVLVDKY